MLNPILNQLANSQSGNSQMQMQTQIQPYKNMLKQIQMAKNPQLELQNMLMQNPYVSQISQLLQLNKGNLQQIAQQLANQKGVDLNALIKELQS